MKFYPHDRDSNPDRCGENQTCYPLCPRPTIGIRGHISQIELFSFNNVNETLMETEINELNPNKSSGMNDIPDNILKESVDIVKSPLTQLFNTYVENQQFPNKLRYVIVTPLYKKEDNYRPISLLPSISIIFERLSFKQISNFVQNKISQCLCGSRKGFNTQHALMRLLDKLNKSVDNGEK